MIAFFKRLFRPAFVPGDRVETPDGYLGTIVERHERMPAFWYVNVDGHIRHFSAGSLRVV